MTRPLTRMLVAATAALALCAATACAPSSASPSGSPTGESITVGLTYQPDIQFAPFYVADAQGWFAQAGLDVTLRHHGSSESLFGAFQAGTEQVVFAGGDEMMQARSQGVDIASFATIYQTYPVVLIVPQDSPIRTLADLRGRSVGIPGPYGENWFALQVMLASADLSQSDVDVVNIGYTQQAALSAGRVDAVVGFSNNDVVAFQQAGFPVRQLTTPTPMPLIGAGLGASPGFIAEDSAQLATFWSVVRRGVQYCVDDPQGAVKLSQAYVPGLTDAGRQASAMATLKATAALYGAPGQIGAQDPALWSQMAQFMQRQGLLAKPVPADEAFTASVAGPRTSG